MKNAEERKKATSILKSSHTNNPTPEQKAYREMVKELRNKEVESQSDNEDSSGSDPSSKEIEPNISKCTNSYDLKLFQEAQALASEAIVSVQLFQYYKRCV